MSIEVTQGDITQVEVAAIVNAANTALLGGGGVDGAIHRAAGPNLLAECRTLGGCPTGHAKITSGYDLAAKHVIHTVGPIWQGGDGNEDALLASCYRCSLEVALKNDITSIAFPAISTGVYRFPVLRACSIAVRTVVDFIRNEPSILQVVFCCFGVDITKAVKTEVASFAN